MKIVGKIRKKLNEYFNTLFLFFRFLKFFVITIRNCDYNETSLKFAIDQFLWLGSEEMELGIQKRIGVYMVLQGNYNSSFNVTWNHGNIYLVWKLERNQPTIKY